MRLILFLVFLFACTNGRAQTNVRDTTVAMFAVQPSYAQQLPGGDLAIRFGTNSNLGLGGYRKLRSNFLFGFEASFLFGNKVVEPGILSNVLNSAGQVVDQSGVMADVFLFERGWTAFAFAGKLFPVIGPNPNCGIVFKVGGGYMRHKVRVQTQQNEVPQLEGDYLEGYDRLTAGPAALAYIGYHHFGNRRLINFHIGLEVMAGFTESLRAYNFDTEQYNEPNRIDLLSGIRVGWSLPIYRRYDDSFHY
ncbi:MAG: hypothetical protein IPI81_08635 [Flavobacteriales bacterium]|nr:hypothetical protein [Flavobacteriales bacterium]MCC6938932.1 hypothetical protein [Flavobacteriales bacterium]